MTPTKELLSFAPRREVAGNDSCKNDDATSISPHKRKQQFRHQEHLKDQSTARMKCSVVYTEQVLFPVRNFASILEQVQLLCTQKLSLIQKTNSQILT